MNWQEIMDYINTNQKYFQEFKNLIIECHGIRESQGESAAKEHFQNQKQTFINLINS